MRQKVLIISNYFPPEMGAASNRMHHLALGLNQRNFDVAVIAPLPNYPTGKIFKGYNGVFKKSAIENGIHINRLWIYASNSRNTFSRLLAMLSYSISLTWFILWNKIPNTVIVQSPPLLVAFTCMLFLKRKKRNLILNVSDLWPKAGLDLGALKQGYTYKVLSRIERFNYNRANLVLGQSDEILSHVKGLIDHKNTFLYRNYPDFELPELINKETTPPLKIVYAGLLGIAQGIYRLCNELNYESVEFHIYGSGPEQHLIEAFIEHHPELPIIYHGLLSRDELHKVLKSYDVAIIPLLNRIYGSVPSKIFEYSRLGLPLLYFGGGEGERIIEDFELGWTATAGDYTQLNEVIASINPSDITLEMKKKIQRTSTDHFSSSNQLDQLANKLYPHP